jgi:GNAT superfamily N-acetyltransferase
MWEDIGFKESSVLDEAERAYRKWAKVQLKNRTLIGWIVETPDHVVAGGGCVWLRPQQPIPYLPELIGPYLLSMFTEPEFRRKGVASKIVEEAIKWCRRKGYRRILLRASKKGRGLYRKYGFTRTWEMRLELTNNRRTGHTR